ncbi:UvrD-helicase domain-containing protein [Candidatus Saccharibacteria bacterium]|nr:UvrD-helicase domain-containing protein [Candidatus Saccharibacteria bacterium]
MQKQGLSCAGCSLDRQQIEAVVACEDAQLVLAAAGSGKTLSLLAKIEYINQALMIPPHQILAISFTRKTVSELRERCAIKGVDICTFHGLGRRLLQYGNDSRSLISEEETARFFEREMASLIAQNPDYAQKMHDFILFYYSTPKNPADFPTHAARISFNRACLRRSLRDDALRSSLPNHAIALDSGAQEQATRDRIRSKDEQLVANWLFVHQIDYQYRAICDDAPQSYRPTFTLIQGDLKVYLDLVYVDRTGHSPYGKDYLRACRWRTRFHGAHNHRYLQLFAYQWREDTVYTALRTALVKFGFQVRRIPAEVLDRRLQALDSYRSDILTFQSLIQAFLVVQKNNLRELSHIKHETACEHDAYAKHRKRLFFDLYQPLFQSYEQYLIDCRYYDFADMINHATELVNDVPECAAQYRYVLLDEVQDLSVNRCHLVRAILQKNANCRLFAVGDDWQSIYRFTGSDLGLIKEFERTFSLPTRRSFIEATHRFGTPTTALSSRFILRNPHQSSKRVVSDRDKRTPIHIVFNAESARRNDDSSAVLRVLDLLLERYGYDTLRRKSIQLISRYNHDIQRLDRRMFRVGQPVNDVYRIDWCMKSHPDQSLSFEFCSIHKSKGITRDFVIVLNMNDDQMGMPAKRESDPLLDALLSQEDGFAYAEERRLFYVAITRARLATYLIANRLNPSPFLLEISIDLKNMLNKMCPRCLTGVLLEKHCRQNILRYCSNYRYGCDYCAKQ